MKEQRIYIVENSPGRPSTRFIKASSPQEAINFVFKPRVRLAKAAEMVDLVTAGATVEDASLPQAVMATSPASSIPAERAVIAAQLSVSEKLLDVDLHSRVISND